MKIIDSKTHAARQILADDFYSSDDPHRIWQAWIPADQPNLVIEVEMKYPDDMPQRANGRGYMFRLELTNSIGKASWENNLLNGELVEAESYAKKRVGG